MNWAVYRPSLQDGKPEMTVRDADGKVTPVAVTTAPAHNYVLGIDFQGRRYLGCNRQGTEPWNTTKTIRRKTNMNAFADILEAIAHAPIEKRAMTNHGVLNEAYAYAKPSSFSRGMRIDIGGVVILLISGTASIDENGVSVHIGDFPAQLRRTFDNITGLLESEGAPGTTLCAPVATCATSIATTTCSMPGAPLFSRSRDSIRCRLRPGSRRICAARSC